MKHAWKLIKNLIFILLTLIVVYLTAAVALSYISTDPPAKECAAEEKIFISSNGVHLFIILPVSHLDKSFLQKLDFPEKTRFISFGWGEKTFYLNTPEWEDLTFPIAAKALLVPSESAMHVSYYPRRRKKWKPLNICSVQAADIARFVQNSVAENTDTFTPLQPKGYGPNNYFFETKGKYSCLKTSNEWVNQALKEGAVKTSLWSPFTFGVMYHVDNQ